MALSTTGRFLSKAEILGVGVFFPLSILGFQKIPNRVTDFWLEFFLGGVTLLGATRSETSGGTPRDLLETRCGLCRYCLGGLLRILAANLMRILLCRVLSQSF